MTHRSSIGILELDSYHREMGRWGDEIARPRPLGRGWITIRIVLVEGDEAEGAV